jgi:transposase
LLRHGLLRASFIPPLEIGELRELTRYRASLVKGRATLANRVQKLAEGGNIKLGQVASDALGVSGRLMLRALSKGETDAGRIGDPARGPLKGKKPELRRAVSGRLTPAQRRVLAELPDRYEEAESAIERVEQQNRREAGKKRRPFRGGGGEAAGYDPGRG